MIKNRTAITTDCSRGLQVCDSERTIVCPTKSGDGRCQIPQEEIEVNRTFVTLLVSTAVALPGLAQQTSTSTQAAPSSQYADRTTDPLPAPATDFWDGDDPNLLNL